MIQNFLTDYSVYNIPLLFALGFGLTGLLITILVDKYLNKTSRYAMIAILVLMFTLLVQNMWEDLLASRPDYSPVRDYIAAYGYIVRPIIIALFIHVVEPKVHWISIAIVALNTVAYLSSPYNKLFFYINENNGYIGGPLSFLCLVCSAILLAYLFFIMMRKSLKLGFKYIGIPISCTLIIILGVVLDKNVGGMRQPITYLTIAMVVASSLYYRWLHIIFIYEHEREFAAEKRIEIMMTQIQPHFLYNTLSTIQSLCRTNPEKASETTERFATYLRHNIDFIEQPNLIPIESEIEHTRIYSDIEMIRFPKIKVNYDVQSESFLVPQLSVQPIVENAIRHGVRGRDDGEVTVSVRDIDNCYKIDISDNGVGFDVNNPNPHGGSHIGISNVRERIEKMCSGTMRVYSTPGKGTVVSILIPKKEANEK